MPHNLTPKRQTRRNALRMFIEICGGIASGKTTLATQLAKAGFVVVFEQFQANPFWQAFYKDPTGVAFETEITFLLQHYHQIRSAYQANAPFACDFSRIQDKAYTRVTLNQQEQAVFDAVYQEVNRKVVDPDLIVFLECDAETELERIRARGREIEAKITVDYLALLNGAIRSELDSIKNRSPIIEIDSGRVNFTKGHGVATTIKLITERAGFLSH